MQDKRFHQTDGANHSLVWGYHCYASRWTGLDRGGGPEKTERSQAAPV